MTWWNRLLRRNRLERELDAELRDHFERQVADYVADGLGEKEARRRTRLEFGGLDQVKEHCRDARGTRWIEDLLHDVRYSARVLLAAPVFTIVAVLSLALGIGANTAIFSLVNSVLLRTLPVDHAERLVLLDKGSWTNPIWEEIRARQDDLFDGATAWGDERFNLARSGPSDYIQGFYVSGRFFEVLGVPAMLGRTFGEQDDLRGGGPDGPVAVISHAFWQRRFGGAQVLGRPLTLDGVAFTVVGVTPPWFFGPVVGRDFDVMVPIGTETVLRGDRSILDNRSTWWLNVTARRRPNQTIEQATAALRGVQLQIREATLPADWSPYFLSTYLEDPFTLTPAASGPPRMREQYRLPLLALMVVVALVLLIACANVANLMLARASGRRHELGVRLALGASRLRVAQQLLTESLLIAATGAGLGLIFARWAGGLLVAQLSTPEMTAFLDLTLDWRVLIFTAAVAITTVLVFGLGPVFGLGRIQPTEAFREQGRGLVGEGRHALSQPLVVIQVALSLVLVVAAALFGRTFSALTSLDLGFDPEPILVVEVNAQRSGLSPEDLGALFNRLPGAVEALPGVAAAGASRITPVSGSGWNTRVANAEDTNLTGRDLMAWVNAVTPNWFSAYGTRLLAGRPFDARDRTGAPPAVIVNDAYVRKFLPGRPPFGHPVLLGGPDEPPDRYQIVGVVENAAYRSVREEFPPTIYFPMAQLEEQRWPFVNLSIKSTGVRPATLTTSVGDALGEVDPNLTLTFRALGEYIDGALVQERLLAMLSGFFGGLALLLAAVGLYGITAYAVSRRRTEIGIRMALGADAGRVVRLVLQRTTLLLVVGVLLGGTVSLWLSRYVAAMLYGLEPQDPVTFAGSVVALALIGGVAAWLPARHAAGIDPAEVLREG